MTPAGTSIAQFLKNFPGFTADYLAETVQTIFLNGIPVDDLGQPFRGTQPVLALSAAMPGLAGAILRRNSFHAALRSNPSPKGDNGVAQDHFPVTLKLFNSIAKQRGEALLQSGIRLKAATLAAFLGNRPQLSPLILAIELDHKQLNLQELQARLPELATINLTITGHDG